MRSLVLLFCGAPIVVAQTPATPRQLSAATLMRQVEVRRTAHGVPHIKAENLIAAGYAEAYVQSEDYGARVAMSLLKERGELARWFGRDSINSDFASHYAYERAIVTYPLLEQATRDVYDGFAVGVNRYIELHPNEFPPGFAPHFTGYDVLAKDIEMPSPNQASKFLARSDSAKYAKVKLPASNPDDGSNAWAFGPTRTK